MLPPCQIIIRELCSLLKFYYSVHNSIRICKRGVVAAYHVVWECVVEQWLGVRRTTHTQPLLHTTFPHNMICCHNTSFANTNGIVNTVIKL